MSDTLITVIHGIIRTVPIVGQVYAKKSVSAPMLIGNKGGIVVEGITPSAPAGAVIDTDFTVTNVSSVILTANANRSSNLFQNNGVNVVYLNFDAAAVAGAGVTLQPNAVWESTVIFQGTVQAITAAGNSRVTVLQT